MASPGILGLPEELLGLIARHVGHKDDLQNLSLSCSALREAALSVLHRQFQIDLNAVRTSDDILKQGYAIHRHIKQLIVSSGALHFSAKSNEHVEWTWKFVQFLKRLPRSKLDSICTPRRIPLSPEVLGVMFEKQDKLRYIQTGPIEAPEQISVPQLQTLEAVEIPPEVGTPDSLKFYADLLSKSKNIKGLSVRAEFHQAPDGPIVLLQGEDDGRGNRIFERIFSNISQDCLPFKLEKLLLCHQKLLAPERILTPYISFEHLHELQIHECRMAWLLLSVLGQQFKASGSALKVLSLHEYTYDAPTNRVPCLEAFLESFKGLRFLEIRWDANIDPDFHVGCLEGHMPTLTDLCLSFMDDDFKHNWLMHERDVVELLHKAPNLRQVALALIDAWPDAGYRGDLGSGLKALLSRSARLEVLRLLDWPLDPHWPPWYRCGYPQEELDEIVNRMVRYVACLEHTSALRLLVVGDWRPHHNFYVSQWYEESRRVAECVCYFPGTRTNCFGRTEIVGIPVAPRKVRHEYPFWDVYSSEEQDTGCLGAADFNLLGRRGPFMGRSI